MGLLLITITLAALAVWRISYMLVNEDGPAKVFERFRVWVAPRSEFLSSLFDCIYCMSIWVGIAMTILYAINPSVLFYVSLPFIFSAVSIFIDYWMSKDG